jgi:nucleoid-associated protein YgaU
MDSSKTQIPVNTRTVGNPLLNTGGEGIYTLYIEDYVHTFLQKNLENGKIAIKTALFGKYIDDKFIVSGAVLSSGSAAKDKDTCAAYFPACEYLGTATVTRNDKDNARFEIVTGGIIILIEDYYIYYDQNEEMQNYLVSWSATTADASISRQPRGGDAARYGKILQAYNKEEAKVSFMWNMLNLLSLLFVVCFMAYGIITINSYNKMQSIQSGIDYCMKMLDTQMAENNTYSENNIYNETNNEKIIETSVEVTQKEDENATEIAKISEAAAEDETEIADSIPQYYIVQKGDTLSNICYEIYGDYGNLEKVCLWNDIKDPNNILCGQKLLLP